MNTPVYKNKSEISIKGYFCPNLRKIKKGDRKYKPENDHIFPSLPKLYRTKEKYMEP